MRLTTPAAAVATAAVLLTVTGCSQSHAVTFEISGDTPSAAQVRYHTPGDGDKNKGWHDVSKPSLPWKTEVSSEYGFMRMEATPTTGTLTCRILADGKEIIKTVGKPGQPVSCVKIVGDN